MSSLLFIETGREYKPKSWLQMTRKVYWALDPRETFLCIKIIHFLNTYGIHLVFLYFKCMKHYIEKDDWIYIISKMLVTNDVKWEGQKGKVWFDETSPLISWMLGDSDDYL